jgi:DNA primase
MNKKKHQPKGIIVGKKFDEAVKQNLALQGLEYDSPSKIYNSNTFYMPVSIMTYKEAMDMKNAIASANNYGYSLMKLSNVLFLDSTYSETRWLLDKKASIKDINIRELNNYNKDEELDTNYRYLLFEIGFEDSNNDGLLNNSDLHDLYISDLNGENLTLVTNKIDVIDYYFQELYSSIFIRYTEL